MELIILFGYIMLAMGGITLALMLYIIKDIRQNRLSPDSDKSFFSAVYLAMTILFLSIGIDILLEINLMFWGFYGAVMVIVVYIGYLYGYLRNQFLKR